MNQPALEIKYVASPTMVRFHKSDSFVRGIRGPLGAGKSTGCAWDLWSRLQRQEPGPNGKRRSRWAVIRNTYRELEDTTLATWLDWFPEEYVGDMAKRDMIHRIRYGDIEADILFRALDRPKDVKKLLSLELTGAWVNEAREIPKAIVEMLELRVGRFPAMKDGGATWSGIIMDTNSMDSDHWWFRMFEKMRPETWEKFDQPSARSSQAENLKNLPIGYYEKALASHDENWIKVYIDNEYGFVITGKPVYPEYKDSVHCATEPLAAINGLPITIGVDWGLTPAAIFAQKTLMGQWRALDECVTEDMGAVRFAEVLSADMQRKFPGFKFEMWGDPAGDSRSQVDERTPFEIFRGRNLRIKPAPGNNDPVLRREAVAVALNRMIDGVPGLLISPRCEVLRKGMAGGYNYKRMQIVGDERFHDVPDKNRYSHPCEALQYLMLGGGENPKVTEFTKPAYTAPYVISHDFNPFDA